jgi:hypothetical protein
MAIDWDEYEPFDPGVRQPLHELSKKEARAAFERLMAAKADRIAALGQLLKANGVELDETDSAVQDLNDWFQANVEADRANSGRLVPMWYSVVNDVALFLGDLIISRHPQLRWTMFEAGKKDAAFQRHVVMGFTKVSNPKYNLDVDMAVATYAHRLIAGQPVEDDYFFKLLRAADTKA